MKNIKNPKDVFYISVITLALIVAIILCVKYTRDMAGRQTAGASAPSLAPKEEKVLVTMNVETIEDGLENMGVLVTQEYYFTQVETYTKEKKILNFINSESGFTYSYDGKVTAGIDFGKITVTRDEETKKSPCGIRLIWKITTCPWQSLKKLQRERLLTAESWRGPTNRQKSL